MIIFIVFTGQEFGASWLGSSSWQLLELLPSEGLTGAGRFTSWVAHSCGGQAGAGGGQEASLPVHLGTFPQGCLSVLTVWQLASLRAAKAELECFYNLASEVTHFHLVI